MEDGHLYASSYSEQSGPQKHYRVSSDIPTGISGIPLDYIHLTLVGNVCSFCCGVSFILDHRILFKRSFRYALSWVGSNIDRTIKVNYQHDDVYQTLEKINAHTVTKQHDLSACIHSHEILLKKEINLHKYLIAICCLHQLTDDIVHYVKTNYPRVHILNARPKSATDIYQALKHHVSYHKYRKYKSKYLNLKKIII